MTSTEETLGWFQDDVSDLPEYAQRARFRPMGVDATGPLVDRAYRSGLPLQFDREVVKNSIEAGATIVKIYPDPVSLYETDNRVFRYTIADNGKGMSGEELVRFFNKLSSSGKIMDADGNFGMGAKIALLPWNQAGIIVMSWKDGVGSMVKVVRDPYTGNYALEPWRVTDEEDYFRDFEQAPDEYKPEWMADHGTVILCLGDSLEDDTYAGPVAYQPKGGINTSKIHRNALNDRFFEFPDHVDISVWEFQSSPIKGEKPQGSFNRVFGMRKGLDERASFRGHVDLSDARVWWWLMPPTQSTGGSGTRSRTGDYRAVDRGLTAAMHDSELYDMLYGDASKHRHHQFGIIWSAVRQNVALIVDPKPNSKGNRASPDTSRRTLIYPGGDELPWARWGEEFAKLMPEPIRNELKKAAPQSSTDRRKINERLRELAPRMHFFAKKPDRSAAEMGADPMTGGNPVGPGPRPRRKRPHGGAGGVSGRNYRKEGDGSVPSRPLKQPRRDPPEARWVNGEDEGIKDRAARYIPSDNMIQINEQFSAYQECLDNWTKIYAPTPESAGIVQTIIKEVFEQELVSKVYHAMSFEGKAGWREQFNFDSPPLQGILSDEALTLAVLGIITMEHVITTRLGGRFGASPRGGAPER